MTTPLTPGFADPVDDAQRCFRAVLDALSHPGRVETVGSRADGSLSPPAPLNQAAAAVLLTLVDHDTPLWLDPDLEPCRFWITFHTGAAACAPERATFGLAARLPDLRAFPAGTDERPEASTTLIVQVKSLTVGRRVRLRGPGIRTDAVLAVDGLPDDFVTLWQRNHALFPRGVDLILCAGAALAALPRSVLVEEG